MRAIAGPLMGWILLCLAPATSALLSVVDPAGLRSVKIQVPEMNH